MYLYFPCGSLPTRNRPSGKYVTMSETFAITRHDVEVAAARIAPHALRTPLVHVERISKRLECDVYFKAENLQHIGAFKARGATNAILQLPEDVAGRGVVTHSSGNHAAAIARAATIRGIPAHVVMPSNSAKNKIEAVRRYGVDPVFCEPTAESREQTAAALQTETGATLVHPYDYPPVMAGQGTVGTEILEQLPGVESVIVPVGGGGLLSGLLVAIKAARPDVQVIAAEPEHADDAARSLRSGKIEMPTRYDTVADGLRTPLGENTFPIIRSLVDDILLVSEDSIRRATRVLLEEAHLVAEPSGAVTLAALTMASSRFEGQAVAAVISGGNVDFDAKPSA